MGSVAAITLDAAGDIYVAGVAPLANPTPLPIPARTTPFSSTPRSISIVKLNSTATAVLNATYFGGSGTDLVTGFAIDSSRNVYLSGTTNSNDFPTHDPIQLALGTSSQNLFVAKLNPILSSLVYSTYLGQNSMVSTIVSPTSTSPRGLAVDPAGDAYVVGTATSGFPTTSGATQTTCSSSCGFLAKLATGGSSLTFATYFGTAYPSAIAVDASQNVYLAGAAFPGFPEVNSFQSCGAAGTNTPNGFISEMSAAGTFTFSTCLGQVSPQQLLFGQQGVTIADLALDGSGNVYIIGSGAATLPLMNPIQSNPGTTGTGVGVSDLFVAAINPNTPSLLFSSYIGAGALSFRDFPSSVAVDSTGNIFASGFSGTFAGAIPILPVYNALQPAPALENPNFPCARCETANGFVMKIAPTNAPAAALVPGAVDFSLAQPVVPVGTSSTPESVTIIDMGSAPLTISSISVTGDFSFQNGCATTVTPAGGICTIQVTFTPTAGGTRTGALTITDNSAGSPRNVPLSGLGGQGSAAISPASLSFPSQQPNTTSSAQTVTLTNSGAINLQVSQVQISGPFAETNTCGTSVFANGGTCTISVTFTPTAAGPATGTLSVTDNAPGSPQSIPLTGTGGTPSLGLGVASGGSASATVNAGTTATYALTIGGYGMTGTATLTCTGAPTGEACSAPASVTLNATTASALSVMVTTTARSAVFLNPGPPTTWLLALTLLLCLALLHNIALTQRPLRWHLRFVPLLAIALCACGGSSSTQSSNGTAAGTYTLIVTAKSGTTTQSQNLILTVQ